MADFQKQISVSNSSKPDRPSLTITNPEDKIQFVNLIEIIPSPEFTRKGKMIILMNGITIFNNTNDTDTFLNLATKPITINNKELKRGSSGKVEFFVWNGTDSNSLDVNVNVKITNDINDNTGFSNAIAIETVNRLVSKNIVLFENAVYLTSESPYTTLLDLKGYQRFWLQMSAQNYVAPSISDELLWTHANNYSIDGDLATTNKDSSSASGLGGDTHYLVYDFGDIDTRVAKASIQYHAGISGGIGTSVLTVNLYVSTDGITWGSIIDTVTQTGTGATTTQDTILSAPSQSLRYVKVEYVWTRTLNVNNANNVGVYEVYDNNQIGGTASISFELKDAQNNWAEIIPSSEFGTVTDGNSIAVQIGDTLTKKYALPSTQTNFRAKLSLTGGGLSTAVSAELVQ